MVSIPAETFVSHLTLEEAESQMAARKKDDVSRWLMKNRTQKTSEEDVSSSGPKMLKLAEKVLNDESEQRKRRAQMVRARMEESQRGEEFIPDELFDDDEGNDNFRWSHDITNEESNELQNKNNGNPPPTITN